MSTFNGLVVEFPEIRIDYFRTHPERKPPSACFLSHIHSDHLQGLESLKMPFVYCSTATKKILLRMEKYPHRINFQKGILESRKQTYKHLRKILRDLPLQTPIELELSPKSAIRVTLFDANHCPGAVMFLIEGNGRAVLYTGDLRAEPWWVNSIVRSPLMLPYSCGIKRLDCIYLDTTFASHDNIYKEFPTKAEGLRELMTKVSKCPKNSVFYFRAWTLGYEDVWITLSSMLKSRVHIDEYQSRIFSSLGEEGQALDLSAALAGCAVGNQVQPGCLTTDSKTLIHSCEPGMDCHAQLAKRTDVVWITPIISRMSDGTEIAEIGAGGGGGDLYQIPELEIAEETAVQALEHFCASMIKDKHTLDHLEEVFRASRGKDTFKMSLEGLGLDQDQELSLKEFVDLLSARDQALNNNSNNTVEPNSGRLRSQSRDGQRVVHFPYSRHSSFSELRHLVSSFRPKDICPCTVDIASWSEAVSMESLFGDVCSEKRFIHDREARSVVEAKRQPAEEQQPNERKKRKRAETDSQQTASQGSHSEGIYRSAQTNVHPVNSSEADVVKPAPEKSMEVIVVDDESPSLGPEVSDESDVMSDISIPLNALDTQVTNTVVQQQLDGADDPRDTPVTGKQSRRRRVHKTRIVAYKAAKSCLNENDYDQWNALQLRSMGWKGHTEEEIVL